MKIEQNLRTKRVGAKITGAVLCRKAGVSRSRLSDIERGVVTPRPDEVVRLDDALRELAVARERIETVAVECGWPGAV